MKDNVLEFKGNENEAEEQEPVQEEEYVPTLGEKGLNVMFSVLEDQRNAIVQEFRDIASLDGEENEKEIEKRVGKLLEGGTRITEGVFYAHDFLNKEKERETEEGTMKLLEGHNRTIRILRNVALEVLGDDKFEEIITDVENEQTYEYIKSYAQVFGVEAGILEEILNDYPISDFTKENQDAIMADIIAKVQAQTEETDEE